MSKNSIISLTIGSIVFLLMSCSESYPYCEDEYNETIISFHPLTGIYLDTDELEGSFIVYSNRAWSVYNKPYWVSLSVSGGNGDTIVDFDVTENTEDSYRSGYIIIRTNSAKEEFIHITQPPSTQFSAIMNTTNYSSSADIASMYITAPPSKSWTISKSDSWVHLGSRNNYSSSYSGKGSETVEIYVDANTSSYSRRSTLTVKCETKTKQFTIMQEAAKTPLEIKISCSLFYGDKDDSETLTITTSSSQYWTVSADAYWVSFSKNYGYGNSTVTVYTSKNPYSYERNATITVKAGSTSKQINIQQFGK